MIRQAVLVMVALISITAFGLAEEGIRADIAFSMIAAGKTLPAGTYMFREAESGTVMTVRDEKTGKEVLVPVLTRLGARPGNEAEIVFDVVGDNHLLAEVHMPGIDGYAFKAATGKHTHVRVKAK